MTQEVPLCRFCLDSNNEKTNKLIDPCGCRGSLQFVHETCLSRWRRMDPERNANICLLCFTAYRMAHQDSLETIPDTRRFPLLLLRFPFFLAITSNYTAILHFNFMPPKMTFQEIFQLYQILYQASWFLLFYSYWNVRNRSSYWKHLCQFQTYSVFFGLFLCNLFIKNLEYVTVIPITLLLGSLYKRHIQILYEMNIR